MNESPLADQIDFFPDPKRYPPPAEHVRGRSGTMDDVLLQSIWQPIYDTAGVLFRSERPGSTHFFQNPEGRGRAYTNLDTAGQFSWPKRYHVWGLEIHLPDEEVAAAWRRSQASPTVTISIGERAQYVVPFFMLYKASLRENAFWVSLPQALYIPSVQNFCVTISNIDRGLLKSQAPVQVIDLRCVLHGWLQREIQ